MNTRTFRGSIRRSLLLRLGITSVLLGLLFAGIAVFSETRRMEEQVLTLAEVASARWNNSIRAMLDKPSSLQEGDLQEPLDHYIAGSGTPTARQGHFVLVRVHDPEGQLLAEYEDLAFGQLNTVRTAVDTAGTRFPDNANRRVLSTRLTGRPYVAVQLPLTDSQGEVRAWLGGVFAVSDAEQARFRANVLKTVWYVVAIVLATALVLYPVISRLLDKLAGLTERLLDANLETMQVLGGAIAKRDSDTDAHNYRVTVYSVRLAEAAGLVPADIQTLIKGALLHDVGKLGIRDNILLKPGRLDNHEFEVMKSHVEHGLDITGRAQWLADAQQVVGAHHEKYSGTGYPHGLQGKQIPVNARIFAIADVFDALTSRRPYKEPMSFEKAMSILEQGRGEHFDPQLLDLFEGIARELYDRFGGKDGDEAREELRRITDRYFRADIAAIV